MASKIIPKYADGTDTGWKAFTKSAALEEIYDGTIYYRKVGNIVYFRSDGLHLKVADPGTIGYIPSDCRPLSEAYFPIMAGWRPWTICSVLRIYTSGAVQLKLVSGVTLQDDDAVVINASYAV